MKNTMIFSLIYRLKKKLSQRAINKSKLNQESKMSGERVEGLSLWKYLQIIIKLARGFHKSNHVRIPRRWRNDSGYLYSSSAMDRSWPRSRHAAITKIAGPNHSAWQKSARPRKEHACAIRCSHFFRPLPGLRVLDATNYIATYKTSRP